MKLLDLFDIINELELPDLEVGDELMVGKFKNRNATIKGFKKDKHNQPIAKTDKGDQQIFKGRVKKLMDDDGRSIHDMTPEEQQEVMSQVFNSVRNVASHYKSGSKVAGELHAEFTQGTDRALNITFTPGGRSDPDNIISEWETAGAPLPFTPELEAWLFKYAAGRGRTSETHNLKGRVKKLMSEGQLDELFDRSVPWEEDGKGRFAYNVDGVEWQGMLLSNEQSSEFGISFLDYDAPETMRQALLGFATGFKYLEYRINNNTAPNDIVIRPMDDKRYRIFGPLLKKISQRTGWHLSVEPDTYRLSRPKADVDYSKARVRSFESTLISEAIAGISKKDAIEIVREIETGRGGIGELAKRKPALMQMSQENLRREHGDVVPLFRVLGIPEDQEMRPEGIVSTTTDWKVAHKMGRDQPGVIMGRDKTTSIHTVLVRYDVPVEKCLADVNMLLEMVVEKLGGFDAIGNKGIRSRRSGDSVPVAYIIQEGMKEDEVIADVTGLKPVVLRFGSHVSGQKEMGMLHGMEAGEFNSPEEYMQHRIDTKFSGEYFPPEEQEELKAMYTKRSPDVKRFLGLSEQFTRDQTALRNYLSSDRMELDVFLHWEVMLDWLDENHPEISAKIGREDPYQWYELPQEIQIEFEQDMGEELQQEQMQYDPANVDTKAHLSFNRMVKTPEWYVHFSDDAESIASNGFTQGVNDMTRLGLTTYLGDADKAYGGYNFAFMADSRDARNSAANPDSYGGDFVMFNMRGAIEVDHHADEETQHIVYGKDIDRRNLVFVSHDGGGNYNVMVHPSKQGRYARDNITGESTYEGAIEWIAKNIDQYRKVITGW